MSEIHQSKTTITQRIRSLFSDNSLTKKASLNALAAGLEYAAKLIVGFVITPIMVAGLGDYFYGAYQVLSRLIGYLTPTSGRPTQALKMKLANKQLVADDEEKRRYVGSTLVILLLFLPLTVVAGTVLTWFSPIWLKADAESFGVIRLTAGLLSFALILQNLISIPRSALEGENLGYKRMGLSVFLVLFSGGLTWLAIALKTGIAGVAAAALTSSLITGLFYFLVVRVYAPWFGIKKASRADNREFLNLSVWFMLWNLINILMMASDVVILGLFNSVQSVTNYTLTKYAPETTINVIAIAVFSILPGLGGIIGSGDLTRAAKVRSEIMSFTWWILTVFGATIILWNDEFLGLWVGSSHYPGGFTNLLVILMVSQFVIMRNDANVIDLTLKLKQKVTLGMISVVLAIGLSIFFLSVLKMGIPGLVFGTMLGRLVLSLAYPLMVGKMISLPWGQQLKSIIRPLIVTILLFIGLMVAGEKYESLASAFASNWIGLIISVGLTFGIVLVGTFFVGFNRSQKEIVIRRLRAIFFSGKSTR